MSTLAPEYNEPPWWCDEVEQFVRQSVDQARREQMEADCRQMCCCCRYETPPEKRGESYWHGEDKCNANAIRREWEARNPGA